MRNHGKNLSTLGARASARWLDLLGLVPVPGWYAEISLVATSDAGIDLAIYPGEWGIEIHRESFASWICVTDVPFAHGRDDFLLLAGLPDLIDVGELIACIEAQQGVEFDPSTATVRTNLPQSVGRIRAWLEPRAPSSSMRRTIELCGAIMHDGAACTRCRGHGGQHKDVARDGLGVVRGR